MYDALQYDSWDKKEAEYNDDGGIIRPEMPAGDRWGVKYEQLLALMISSL